MVTLGLDLGHTSIGWALIDSGNNKILDGGVQIFEAPEDEKQNTLASVRRSYRSARTTNKNHKKRILKIKKLCSKYGLVSKKLLITPKNGIAPLFKKNINNFTPLRLRYEGLRRKLSGKELTRVIIHIASRRGFKYDIDDDKDEEAGKIKKAQGELKHEFEKQNYQTYGEFLYKEYELKGKKTRNGLKKDKTPDYKFSIHRDDLTNELQMILKKQKEFDNSYVTDEFIDKIIDELLFVNEPKSFKNNIGNCSLIENQKRASKALYSSECYVSRSILNNLRVKEPDSSEYRELSQDEKELLFKEAHNKKITKKEAKKLLNISNKSKFKGDETDEIKHIIYLESYLRFKTYVDDDTLFEKFFTDRKLYENTANLLTYEKSIKRRREKLKEFLQNSSLTQNEQDRIFDKLLYLSFSGYLNISTKAVEKILPYLEKGYRVDQAILEQDLKIETKPLSYLPPLKDTLLMIPNPTVVRAITKSRHLINAILKKYRELYHDKEWTFDMLNIELAREINTQKDKKEIITAQNRDRKEKESAVEFIEENCGAKFLSSKNILKVRLWRQQDEYCLYSMKKIETKDLINDIVKKDSQFEVDHILPISRSSDDSISNKVLVLSSENQNKSNKTPYEYFGKDKQRWDKFENFVFSKDMYKKLGRAKVGKLTMKDFASREQDFLNRHLNDTRTISKTVKNYIEKYLKFKESSDIKSRVVVVSGKLTNTLRHQWGLENKNRDNHYHHFEDAVLIAFSNRSIINRLSKYYHDLETYKRDGKDKPKFTKPYESFSDDINDMLKNINVVKQTKIKNNGKIFEDNPKKGGIRENGKGSIVRVDVFKDLKKDKHYFIPIYLKDINKPLTTRFISRSKSDKIYDENQHKFIFSIYPNDLIQIKTKEQMIKGYFIKIHSTNGLITLQSMDNVENDIFKKELRKYTLKIGISDNLDKESRKEIIDDIATIPIIKKKKPKGVYTLYLDISITDVTKSDKLNEIVKILSNSYQLDIKNNTNLNIDIPKQTSKDIKLSLQLDADINNRALKVISTGGKIEIKKLKIDLLGNIMIQPYETKRKPFKRG